MAPTTIISLGALEVGDQFKKSPTGVTWEVESIKDSPWVDNYRRYQCFAVESGKPELMSNLYTVWVPEELANARR